MSRALLVILAFHQREAVRHSAYRVTVTPSPTLSVTL